MNQLKMGFFLMVFILLAGCQVEESTPMPTAEPEIIIYTQVVVVTATPELTVEVTPTIENETEIIELHLIKDENGNDTHRVYPNLWTEISPEKVSLFTDNWISEYTFDQYGNLWMVGNFGIIYRELDGTVTHYSMTNGLPINGFATIAIAPDGTVWAGGFDWMLVRFDGTMWHDEGRYLPPPYDPRDNPQSGVKFITDIDFDSSGNVWVLTHTYEIFTQVYDQWMSFNFPKQLVPVAGGGGSANGIRVFGIDNIYLERNGCCMNPPSAYHFDGKNWEATGDYHPVEEKFQSRHTEFARYTLSELIGVLDEQVPLRYPAITYPPENLDEIGAVKVTEIFYSGYKFQNISNEMFTETWDLNGEYLIDSSEQKHKIFSLPEDFPNIMALKTNGGTIVFSSDTSVYFLENDRYEEYELLAQDEKPCVTTSETDPMVMTADFHPRYQDSFCGHGIFKDFVNTVHHTAKLLHYMDDGTLLFATDHLLAQWKDGGWRSFYFDTVTFDSVTVDDEDFIWVYAGVNGFLRFSPDIFEDYVDYWAENE